MSILVTGAAGFIGMHVCKYLLNRGDVVIGIDNLNDYYDVKLKKDRIANISSFNNFSFIKTDIKDYESLCSVFDSHKIDRVIHLAAQAGVRYSLVNPGAYVSSNIHGFMNILELCRHNSVDHLVYASSSSVYGSNTSLPFKESDNTDHPLSLYAASKKSNEMMAHTYSHLYDLPTSGLRFFTVYGPWGRPDMALFIFCKAILQGEFIEIFNQGDMKRDFTYIDDIVEGVIKILDKPPAKDAEFCTKKPKPNRSISPYRIFNIGNSNTRSLMEYIETLEEVLDKKAKKRYLDMQPGDVKNTYSDTSEIQEWVNFKSETNIESGIQSFVNWYKRYYQYD